MTSLFTDINTERLIDEVKLRRSLWDSASEDYKDRDLKKRHWTELCTLFYPQFDSATAKEKAELCQGLQGKWKNIKDCYRRYLKSLKTKSGQARKKIKTYVYGAQMSFIDTSIALQPTEASPITSQTPSLEDDSEGPEELERAVMSDEEQSFSSRSTMYRRRKQRLENKLEKYIDTFGKSKAQSAEDECDDLNFFKSLLPLVKPLSIDKKIQLRMEFMKMAYEYSQHSSTQVIAPPDSITTPRSNDVTPSTSTQPTAQLPLGNNWFGHRTNKQPQVYLNQQPLLNHTATSHTVGKTEVKKYHELQPMRRGKTTDMQEEGASPPGMNLSARQHQENVASNDFLGLGVLPNTNMSDDYCYSEGDFA